MDNDIRFIANFMYTIKPNVTTDPLHFPVEKMDKLVPDIEESAKT
jgi:hypothetical protein